MGLDIMKQPSFEELKFIIVPLLFVVGLFCIFLPVFEIVSLNPDIGYFEGVWLFISGRMIAQSFYIGIGLILVSILYFWLIRKYD